MKQRFPKYRTPQHLALTSTLDSYMFRRCGTLKDALALDTALDDSSTTSPTTTITTTPSLHDRLSRLRPHLAPTLTRLSPYQLTQLYHACIDDHRSITVQCKARAEYLREVRADAAGIHGEGVAKRSTTSGVLTNQQVERRVSKEVELREKLQIRKKEIEHALANLRV